MNRFSKPELSCFDAIVNAGERIQDAIEKAPENPAKPFKILIRNGVYHEKVIIDRPNIVLVGEDRDSVIIQYAETTASQTIKEYKGKPVHMGVIVLQDNANDCIISGITVYNNYGSTVEKTHIRWPSMARRHAPSSSTAISLPTATMHSHYGARMEECTIMPTSTCAVRGSTSCALVADAMPHAASLSATAEPSSGTTAEVTSTTSLS